MHYSFLKNLLLKLDDSVINKVKERIIRECTPQEVYDYEYENWECESEKNDRFAVSYVIYFWGRDAIKGIYRNIN